MFTAEQKAELEAPLNRAHVKPPAPGKYGEYIEGWRVIDEANRIFGFDGWTRETVEMIETNRDLKGDKWHVGYLCKARVVAHLVTREGTGFGSGVSKQLGDAIESAVKEAETDAMKRALMTFGNPFGLALYDKTKANVADAPPAPPAPVELPPMVQMALDQLPNLDTVHLIQDWWTKNKAVVEGFTDEHYTRVVDAMNARLAAVKTMDRVAA